jgi:hypothetical protein
MTNTSNKIHINAVFQAVDGLFSEAVEVTDETLRAEIMEGEANIKGSIYQYQHIYSRNTEALRALAESRLSAYLKQHPDNSLQLFVDTEVKTARLHQSHLPKFKTDSRQKTYFFRLERWIEVLEEMLPQQAEAKPKKLEAPQTFEELFHDPNFIFACIDILKKVEPPLIDTECNYIGKLKGGICVWIDEMERQGFVKHFSDRKIYASLLPQRIKRFSIDESMFGKTQKRAEEKYREDLKTLLSQIKLSQYSQNGKLGK